MRGMTGAEQLDRGRADGPAYRDRLGLVSEDRPAGRPRMVLAVVAVCGAGMLAGLGLFGGSAAKPSPPPVAGIVKAADAVGSRPEAGRTPAVPKPRVHRPVKRLPHTSSQHRREHGRSTGTGA